MRNSAHLRNCAYWQVKTKPTPSSMTVLDQAGPSEVIFLIKCRSKKCDRTKAEVVICAGKHRLHGPRRNEVNGIHSDRPNLTSLRATAEIEKSEDILEAQKRR